MKCNCYVRISKVKGDGTDYKIVHCPTHSQALELRAAASKATASWICFNIMCPNEGLDGSTPCDHNERRDMEALNKALALCQERK